MNNKEREEREKKKANIKLKFLAVILVGSIVLNYGAWVLLHHDFNIIGQVYDGGSASDVFVCLRCEMGVWFGYY